MALLVLLLAVGSIFLVYRLSTNSTGEGIDVDTPRSSDIKREPQIIRLHDSNNEVLDLRVPESSLYHTLNQEYPGIERIHDEPPIYLVNNTASTLMVLAISLDQQLEMS
jgi:hypothetical protein